MEQAQIQKIVVDVTEKVLLRMPEVIGNLLKEHAAVHKMKQAFFKAHPEFVGNELLIAKVVQKIEQGNIDKDYKDILDMAVPVIQRSIQTSAACDTKTKPTLDQLTLDMPTSNGAL